MYVDAIDGFLEAKYTTIISLYAVLWIAALAGLNLNVTKNCHDLCILSALACFDKKWEKARYENIARVISQR